MILNYDLSFDDLYSLDGLRKIDGYFIEKLLKYSPELCNKMLDARKQVLYKIDESKLILNIAPQLEEFILELFKIQNVYHDLILNDQSLNDLYTCNKILIQKHIIHINREITIEDIKMAKIALMMYDILLPEECNNILSAELDMAKSFLTIYTNTQSQDVEKSLFYKDLLVHVENYSLWAIYSYDGQMLHKHGALFKIPKQLNSKHLIDHLEFKIHKLQVDYVTTIGKILVWIMLTADSISILKQTNFYRRYKNVLEVRISCKNFLENFNYRNINYFHKVNTKVKPLRYTFKYIEMSNLYWRNRRGFALNDVPLTHAQVLYESHHCLYCHNRNKDSCAHGILNNNLSLNGCPLKQKISEMHFLRKKHNIIGAFATIIIDNPMVAATGRRICNDCTKSCIFQKQTPIDTPSVESSILHDVLNLPFGFEIYALLTKWNPLNFNHTLPKNTQNYKVMVVGMGPAGFTLAHYLLNAGIHVIGIEALKIEPLPSHLSGVTVNGERCKFQPIEKISELFQSLENRIPRGFGGVMEYGITARWNKNMLMIINLLLTRRNNFRLYDGTRFGSNVNEEMCRDAKIDHIALAIGAGIPEVPKITNMLCKGVRMSSDFLMNLQLSGAYRMQKIIPLQLRVPIVVIGGGLTAVDIATEAIQYYCIQVRKFYKQYKTLRKSLLNILNDEEKIIANEYILHAKQLKNSTKYDWQKVKILYRKTLQESSAYKVNHEELQKAFEEGIVFVENATPIEIVKDKFGHCKGIICKINHCKTFIEAKSIIIATGTKPNTILNLYGNNISYFGDADINYSGSVVKAMASAKYGYKRILSTLNLAKEYHEDTLNVQLISKIVSINKLTNNIIEILVDSPAAAANFKPGQFYKLQQYESGCKNNFFMENIALTGFKVQNNILSLIVLEIGTSTKLCKFLKPHDKVVLMGPTGSPTQILQNKNILLIGGGVGNAVLVSIGKAMRQNGCNVTYIAGYKNAEDRFKVDDIEASSDQTIWCCDNALLSSNRANDICYQGDIVNGIRMCIDNKLINIDNIDHMIVVGSNGLMNAIAKLRKEYNMKCNGIASINSPMNCMMHGVCAQCLQSHKLNNNKQLFIFTCATQDQNIDTVNFSQLNDRLQQNSLMEKFSNVLYKKFFHS